MDGRDPPSGRIAAARPPAAPNAAAHQIVVRGRAEATIGGVVHVDSFDDREIVLDTELGSLTLTGHDLQIKQLDLAQGTFRVEGRIDTVAYAADAKSGRGARSSGGVLGRLFR